MNTREEYEQLKRNNRRRLIGAVVVVAIAALILFKVLSHRSVETPSSTVEIAQDITPASTALPNPLSANEVPAASDVLAPLPEMPEIAPSEPVGTLGANPPEGVASSPTSGQPIVELPVIKPSPKTDKPAKPTQPKLTPPKLTPREILEGKAGKSVTAPRPARALIQAGAFTSAQQAEAQRNHLAQIGISAKVHRATSARGEVYRVRIGPFASHDEARRTLAKIQANGFDGILVNQ